jgi:hypothetical protein
MAIDKLSAELEAALTEYAGAGVSTDSADFATPQFKIEQAGGLECDRASSTYIDGCEPGDLVITPGGPVFKGETGATAIHCGQLTRYSEFLAGRQGFITSHRTLPGDCESRPADNGAKRPILVRTSNKNVIIEVREVFLIVEGIPCVWYAHGTQHTTARRMMTVLAQKRLSNGRVQPSFATRFKLTTTGTRNSIGKWRLRILARLRSTRFRPRLTLIG